jgi:hypothetical protein
MRRWLLSLILLIAPSLAWATSLVATNVIVSPGPSEVGVTIYRDPSRGDGPIDRDNPNSFAFISETRIVDLPAGPVTIRFEGVAGGIVPQTAILFGADPRERNRDAALLSQGGLVDAFTGQQVVVRRTNRATGEVSEERATLRSAADRMVVSTPRGAEAMYCSGLNQALIYPNAPASLSAKPVLSMTTKDQPGGRATITLAYLAGGFDWDANYVATLAPDGKSLAMFSWLTMVSADETSFIDATTSAVAGRINRSDETRDSTARDVRGQAESLNVRSQCWPEGTTTSDLRMPIPPSMQPSPFMQMMVPSSMETEVVIVTASKREARVQFSPVAVTAVAENVGDLILYRIPVPVTVAAQSQKQMAFLANTTVKGEVIYRVSVGGGGSPGGIEKLFRFTNTRAAGLGRPLPAGKVVMYQDSDLGRHLLGEISVDNKASGEDVEYIFGDAQNVTIEEDNDYLGKGERWIVRNANPMAVRVEIEFIEIDSYRFARLPSGVMSKPDKKVWSVVVPPNSDRKFRFETVRID